MKIAWLAVNASFAHSSLAAPLLQSSAIGVAADWCLIQATVRDPVPDVAARLIEAAPDVCAASLYVFNRAHTLGILARLKTVYPSCRVIVGGPELLGDNEPLLRANPFLDAALRGEGELAFLEWLRLLDQPASWTAIGGLCRLDEQGAYRDGGLAPSPTHLDDLPSPVDSPLFSWDRSFVQLETSRGCGNRCAFCVSSLSHGVRSFSLDRVYRELLAVAARDVGEVRLIDRTFNQPTARCLGLLRLMRQFPRLRFHVEIHPGQLPAAVRAELAAMPPGQLHLDVGLQTTDPAVLRACHRRGAVTASLDGLRFLCGAANLGVHADLIAGLPGATLATTLADLATLIALGPAEIQLETLKVLPGTPLKDDAARLGLRYAPDPPYELLQSSSMSAADLHDATLLSRLIDRFYNPDALRDSLRAALAHDPDLLPTLLAWMRSRGGLGQPLALEARLRLLDSYFAETRSPARLTLHRNWLLYGLATEESPAGVETWPGELPPGGTWQLGSPSLLASRHVRLRCLTDETARTWFIYDRALHAQHAVGIYTIPHRR